uniref:WD_REPEATS_REGION domain-containing protein n=1 Tax=Macrostomum lignano TaxID=282301 RepID=A0A1I8GFC8_9PLAT
MSIAGIQLRHAFGLRTGVAGNIYFVDEQTVVYPCGNSIVLHNVDQKTQRFISLSEKCAGITAMAVSPNRRFVAVAEAARAEEKPLIHVYDVQTTKKKKTVSSAEVASGDYVSVAFSPDSKYLAGQSGKPDYHLVYWSWEKNKQLAIVKSLNVQVTPHASVNQIAFNPQDSTQVSVVGNGTFKLYRYSENNLKQFAVSKTEPQNFPLLGVGRENCCRHRQRQVGADGERRAASEFTMAESASESGDRESDLNAAMANQAHSIAAYSKGFAVSCGAGRVHLFERMEDGKEYYKKAREIRIPADPFSADPSVSEQQIIIQLSISPSEENLVAATDRGQIYQISLASSELGKGGDYAQFEQLSHSFHSSQVLGLDVCARKPLVATCSVDRSVRIWNFETNQCELYKEFAEEAYSVALHPSGLFLLVGFSDKLRLMNLLIDDIRTFKEFTIRGCRECAFSNGGHLFAAVHGNIIQIFSTISFENVGNFKGHNGKIKGLVWSNDDSKLVSCGMDGAVYEWEVATGKRLREHVLKTCSYTGVAATADVKTTYAVGSDGKLKEITDEEPMPAIDAGEAEFTSLAMSNSGRMMFAGTKSGSVRAIKFPFTAASVGGGAGSDWQEVAAHSGGVNKMRLVCTDEYMVTVGDDGCVLIWKVTDKEGRGLKRDKETGWAEEILITKSDLEEKNALTAELNQRVEELKIGNEYQLRMKDMNYNDKIKELTEKFIQEMESLKTKNQVLKTEKDKEEAKHEEQLQEVMEKHSKEVQDMEAANNQKLMMEYEKYQELQSKSQKMQEDYERQLQEMEEARQKKDADREILDSKIKYEKRLREEKESNTKLKSESGIMKKKFTSLQKEIDDHKDEIKKLQTENQKLNNVIRNLQKDIDGLKKEIQERDETIQDKEKRIYDLKKKNQELEKFKFVLDYKIKELKKQIEPREQDIKNYKEQIQEMESELERFHKQNTQLELNISEMRDKLKAVENDLKNEKTEKFRVEAAVRRFKTDLHNCVNFIQEPKQLKESIMSMYRKHVRDDDMASEANMDADIQKEFARQREHLERSVASLRKKLAKENDIHRADYVRIMQENVSLIKEINDLRRDLKKSRTQIHDLEAAVGLHRKNNDQAKQLVAMVTSNKSNPILEKDMEEKERTIETQRLLIQQLRTQIHELETRPLSAGKQQLPPLVSN